MSGDELPEGWTSCDLGRLISPSKKKVEAQEARGRPYVGLEHIESNTNRLVGHGNSDEVRSTMAVFSTGDVLFSKLRPYLNKVAVAPFDGVGSTEILVFERKGHLESKYLTWLLSRRETVQTANDRSAGVQLPRVTFDKIADIKVPLAPLHEQRRIVTQVEALLQQVNRAKGRLDRVPVILKRFRQAVLAAACSGELTRECRGDEDTGQLPQGWHTCELQDLAQKNSSAICAGPFGTIFKAHDFRDNGIPIIFLRHVGPGEYRTTKPGFMDSAKWEELFRPYSVWGGELLVAKLGDPPGCCAIYPKDIGPAMVTPDVIKMSVNEDLAVPEFIMHYLNSEPARQRAFGVAYGATRPRMNLDIFRGLEVPLPPLAEQAEIVRQVHALFTLADTIEARVKAATAKADKLPQAILSKAFSGELVPTEAELARAEGRTYETAEELLKRVTAAKGAVPAKTRGKRKVKS